MNDLEIIDARRAEWVAVVNQQDRDRYADLFTPDAVWFPPGLAAIQGREVIREWLRPFFEQYDYEFSISSPRVRVAGSWAIERGTFTSTLKSLSDGASSSHTGTYLVLWRREGDDQWYIERYLDITEMLQPHSASGHNPR